MFIGEKLQALNIGLSILCIFFVCEDQWLARDLNETIGAHVDFLWKFHENKTICSSLLLEFTIIHIWFSCNNWITKENQEVIIKKKNWRDTFAHQLASYVPSLSYRHLPLSSRPAVTPPWSEWFVRGSEGALDKRRRGTNGEEVYYWRIGRGGGLHERARVGRDRIQYMRSRTAELSVDTTGGYEDHRWKK